jgi:hypothetical protein
VCFFLSSFEGGGVGMIARCAFLPWYKISISLRRVIRVHSLVGEVDNGVRWVGEAVLDWLSTLWVLVSLVLHGIMPYRAVSEGTTRGFPVAPCGIPKEDFFLGGVAMRCRVPSTSATHEMVSKQKIAPGLKVILLLKMMAMELALIDDTPPTWHATCQCFVSNHTPEGTLVVLLDRTVSWIVTRWFALGHERESDKQISAGSSRFEERNTLLPGMALYTSGVTGGAYRAVGC